MTSEPTHPISDRAVSTLRTVVPVLWGSAVAWLLTVVVLPTEVTDLLTSDLAITAVTAVVVGAWYIAWRWAEPHVPDGLSRLVLGSARSPSYAPGHVVTDRRGPSPDGPASGAGRPEDLVADLPDELTVAPLVHGPRADQPCAWSWSPRT